MSVNKFRKGKIMNNFYAKVQVAADVKGYTPKAGDKVQRLSGYAYRLPKNFEFSIEDLEKAKAHMLKIKEDLSK